MSEQKEFHGFARVEVMGHQTHLGLVTTEVYGAAVFFRVDQPEIPERLETLAADSWRGVHMNAGSVVRHPPIPGGTVLVGSASIYRIIPCTEEVCIQAIEESLRRPFTLVSSPATPQLPAPFDDDDDDDDEDEEPSIKLTARQLYDSYRDHFTTQNLPPWETLPHDERSGWVQFLTDLNDND